MVAKRGFTSSRSNLNVTGQSGSKLAERSARTTWIRRSTRLRSMVGIGPAFDAHGRGAAPAAEQHVDDGIDHRGIDDHQAVIIPLLRLEHRQHGRERDGVQVVAEAQAEDVVDGNFDVVAREIPQAGGEDADQPVEDDLQHRQAFIGYQAGIDDAVHAGAVAIVGRAVGVAEQIIDLALVQRLGDVVRGRVPLGVRIVAHWTSNSVNRTSTTRAGAAARLARAISCSRRR